MTNTVAARLFPLRSYQFFGYFSEFSVTDWLYIKVYGRSLRLYPLIRSSITVSLLGHLHSLNEKIMSVRENKVTKCPMKEEKDDSSYSASERNTCFKHALSCYESTNHEKTMSPTFDPWSTNSNHQCCGSKEALKMSTFDHITSLVISVFLGPSW